MDERMSSPRGGRGCREVERDTSTSGSASRAPDPGLVRPVPVRRERAVVEPERVAALCGRGRSGERGRRPAATSPARSRRPRPRRPFARPEQDRAGGRRRPLDRGRRSRRAPSRAVADDDLGARLFERGDEAFGSSTIRRDRAQRASRTPPSVAVAGPAHEHATQGRGHRHADIVRVRRLRAAAARGSASRSGSPRARARAGTPLPPPPGRGPSRRRKSARVACRRW